MRNTYSKSSLKNLKTCHFLLRLVFIKSLRGFDHSITEGYRGKDLQNHYFQEGSSKVQWPDSAHNHVDENGDPCSLAIHALPYPNFDWNDRERFHYFAGHIMGNAKECNILLRWGGDWKGNTLLNKNNYKRPFDDLAHWELIL